MKKFDLITAAGRIGAGDDIAVDAKGLAFAVKPDSDVGTKIIGKAAVAAVPGDVFQYVRNSESVAGQDR